MIIVSAADLHVDSTRVGGWDAKEGVHSNWVEAQLRVRDLVDVCNDRQADLLTISGDVFDAGRPTAEAVARLRGEMSRLKTAKVVVTNGNHDQASVVGNHRTPIDAYIAGESWCFHAAASAEVVEYNGFWVACVPWYRVAGTSSLDKTSMVLREDVDRLAQQLAGKPSMLIGHLSVDEAMFSSGRRGSELLMGTSVLEASVPTDEIDRGPWAIAQLGHIHRRQDLGVKTRYVGSTYKVSFGERLEAKGCDVLEIADDGTLLSQEFVEFRVRELVQVDITNRTKGGLDLDFSALPRDIIRLMLPSGQDLTARQEDEIRALRADAVEVQVYRLPKPSTSTKRRAMSIDTDPSTAIAAFARDSFPDDPERIAAVVREFGLVQQMASK